MYLLNLWNTWSCSVRKVHCSRLWNEKAGFLSQQAVRERFLFSKSNLLCDSIRNFPFTTLITEPPSHGQLTTAYWLLLRSNTLCPASDTPSANLWMFVAPKEMISEAGHLGGGKMVSRVRLTEDHPDSRITILSSSHLLYGIFLWWTKQTRPFLTIIDLIPQHSDCFIKTGNRSIKCSQKSTFLM